MLLFAAGLSILTTFLFGLAPAVQTLRLNLTEALRESASNTSPGRRRQAPARPSRRGRRWPWPSLLLLGAGLMLRSLDALMKIDLGFQPRGVLTLQLQPPEASYEKPETVVAFYRTLLERVRAPARSARGRSRTLAAAGVADRGLGTRRRRLRGESGPQRQGRLAGRLRRRRRGSRGAAGPRADLHGFGPGRDAPGRPGQRDPGPEPTCPSRTRSAAGSGWGPTRSGPG